MQEEIDFAIDAAQEAMEGAVAHLERGLVKIRAGKAAPDMVDSVMVEYYGGQVPIKNVANVSAADARTLVITPWEKGVIPAIERAIFQSNLGMTPQNDGIIIRLNLPFMTEERRRTLGKQAKEEGENAKIVVRNARRDAMEDIRKTVKAGYSEDGGKVAEEKVQKMTNDHVLKIDALVAAKEKDIMTV
jgi:ribosome recycling factor